MVTQPLEKPVSETPIAKVTTTQASTTDTLITLKKSGKVLMLPKGLSAKQIDKLDKFLVECCLMVLYRCRTMVLDKPYIRN